MTIVREMSKEVPRIRIPIPAVTRDPKDDYGLAYALVGEVDYLVTGDEDLLALQQQIHELEILTTRQFSDLL